ncbi:MAG TPA: hypothetical protein VJR23_07825 [Candidatus Acidoferrales bacterium]|nr:hypothetical protein [Candidatus Acidoferrales bacterium]
MSCPICEKRPPKRFCPAKGEKICAVCCGRERELTIDCPSDCPHLLAAHRYEAEHREPPSREDFPYSDVDFPPDFIYDNWELVAGIATAILEAREESKELRDSDVFTAIEALAETHRTLDTGIYYERPPDALPARALYARIGEFLKEYRKRESDRAGFPKVKDAEIFRLFVFLLRIGKRETTGRPRSRAFLSFLNANFPRTHAQEKEPSRIILP